MFKRKLKYSGTPIAFFEDLECRRMLSVSAAAHLKHASVHRNDTTTTASPSTTTFSGLQTSDVAAYNELNTLATADTTTIASTQTVYVRPINSTTTYYTVVLTPSTGTKITLTSDENGNPITPPTSSTTTFGAVTDTAATGELTTLAGDLNLTAPASTDSVTVRTADGLTTYSIKLAPSSGTGHDVTITVDAAGNPAGNERIPFSALPTLVSTGLTGLASADSLTIAGTQEVQVRTAGGVTTYTVRLTGSGQSVEYTVDTAGDAATPVSGGGFGFGGHGHGFGGGRRDC
jgi:hypothetical protein